MRSGRRTVTTRSQRRHRAKPETGRRKTRFCGVSIGTCSAFDPGSMISGRDSRLKTGTGAERDAKTSTVETLSALASTETQAGEAAPVRDPPPEWRAAPCRARAGRFHRRRITPLGLDPLRRGPEVAGHRALSVNDRPVARALAGD
jgi:hypothetical protein